MNVVSDFNAIDISKPGGGETDFAYSPGVCCKDCRLIAHLQDKDNPVLKVTDATGMQQNTEYLGRYIFCR